MSTASTATAWQCSSTVRLQDVAPVPRRLMQIYTSDQQQYVRACPTAGTENKPAKRAAKFGADEAGITESRKVSPPHPPAKNL